MKTTMLRVNHRQLRSDDADVEIAKLRERLAVAEREVDFYRAEALHMRSQLVALNELLRGQLGGSAL